MYANEWIDTCTRYLAIMNVNRNAAYLSVHGAPRVAGAVPAEGPRPAALAHARVVLAAAVRAAVHVAHARLAVVARPPAGARASDDGSRAGTFKVFQSNRIKVLLSYCDTGYCDTSLIVEFCLKMIGSDIEFAAVKSPVSVTIGYCELCSFPQQCHNILETVYP